MISIQVINKIFYNIILFYSIVMLLMTFKLLSKIELKQSDRLMKYIAITMFGYLFSIVIYFAAFKNQDLKEMPEFLAELFANFAIIGLVLATALTTTLIILAYGLLKKYKNVEKAGIEMQENKTEEEERRIKDVIEKEKEEIQGNRKC